MSRRVPLHTTISKKTKATINRISTLHDGRLSTGVDYICEMYADNKDILEDPDAAHVARAYISERNRRLFRKEY